MVSQVMTDKELDLLTELLEAEAQKLMVETRHTDSREMKKEVRERLRIVDRLVERFKEIKAGDYAA